MREKNGRRERSWEQIDDKRWARNVRNGDREVTIDIVEGFFYNRNQ